MTDADLWRRAKAIFSSLLEVAPSERPEALLRLCDGDEALRREVQGLLDSKSASESFLEGSPLGDCDLALAAPPTRIGPYRLEERLGQGAMGVVYRARRENPDRVVALKILNGALVSSEFEARFDAEVRSLARLQHPGIATIFESGRGATDSAGLPWFAMELIEGCSLEEAAEHRSIDDRVRLVIEIARAIQHAHQRGVIHRDLKPSNTRVGEDGRLRVLDFGIAVLSDEEGTRRTKQGQVMGTMGYMSPEAAAGTSDLVDVRSDVYSIGVILFRLLTGALPIELSGLPPLEALRCIVEKAPRRLSSLLPKVSPELDAITQVALAKRPEDRYVSSAELASDLERALAHQPILARPPGTLRRLRLLIERRRGLALAGLALLVAIALGVAGTLWQAGRASEEARRAGEEAREKGEALEEVERLADLERLDELEALEEATWPQSSDSRRRMRDWIAAAEDLLGRRELHGLERDRLRSSATLLSGSAASKLELARLEARREEIELALDSAGSSLQSERIEAVIDSLDAEIEALEQQSAKPRYRFARAEDRWRHDLLCELLVRLDALDVAEGPIAQMKRRLQELDALEARFESKGRSRWAELEGRLREDLRFKESRISARVDLWPLGADPVSGLEELLHLPSHDGEPAERDASGRIPFNGDCGLIFVLLPPGRFLMGAQARMPGSEDYEAGAQLDEAPSRRVSLSSFGISKFEMSQGQWRRLAGENPSLYRAGYEQGEIRGFGDRNPVERVSWAESRGQLLRFALDLPTEAQWEYAARAGTRFPWWTGADRKSLRGAANLADGSAARFSPNWEEIDEWTEYEDGHVVHAPVDSMRANPFGLHHVHGNVEEFCRDHIGLYTPALVGPERLHLVPESDGRRVVRGGSYRDGVARLRSAARNVVPEGRRTSSRGLRPVLRLD